MPATVQTDPLGIWCMFSDGSTARFDLSGLPCPGLAADLLAGLAELIHPHGSLDAAGFSIACFEFVTSGLSRNLELWRNDPEGLKEKVRSIWSSKDFRDYSGTGFSPRRRVPRLVLNSRNYFASK